MVRLKFSIDLGYEIGAGPSDFIFLIHAARTGSQSVVAERLTLHPGLLCRVEEDSGGLNRLLRLAGRAGSLRIGYAATVDIEHHAAAPEGLAEVPIGEIPAAVLPYLYPSRYCQSDQLRSLASREFGHLPHGHARIRAIEDWVRRRTRFAVATSNASTGATETLVEGAGVCRDFAHLMIALCRALNIPARFVTGIDYGADAAYGPTDFHAYVEVYLSHRWYLFEPSGISPPMGLVRIGTGRDAADVAFATIFGAVASFAPMLSAEAVADPANGLVLPTHRPAQALSSLGDTVRLG